MSENIILKKNPKIEFQFLDNGFQLIDEQTEQNSGFYAYNELQSIELNNVWFPRLAKWVRAFTWIFNGVPFFPDAESCKKANVIIHFRKTKLGMWLTDSYMADKSLFGFNIFPQNHVFRLECQPRKNGSYFLDNSQLFSKK